MTSEGPVFAGGASCCSMTAISKTLERRVAVSDLLTPGGLLDVAHPAASAIGDAGLGDALVGNGVVAVDIGRPDDAGYGEHAQFVVHADLLLAADDEIAVRQHPGHDGGDGKLDVLGPGGMALAVELAVAVGTQVSRAGRAVAGDVEGAAQAPGALAGA